MRAFFAMEKRGELPKGTAERWARETPNIKNLPEKVKQNGKKKGRGAGKGGGKGLRKGKSKQ
jgi:hypothetical protein